MLFVTLSAWLLFVCLPVCERDYLTVCGR